MFDIEDFWAAILSREPEQIREAYASLPNADEQQAVLAHLTRMVTEPDWAEPQRISAQAALDALQDPAE